MQKGLLAVGLIILLHTGVWASDKIYTRILTPYLGYQSVNHGLALDKGAEVGLKISESVSPEWRAEVSLGMLWTKRSNSISKPVSEIAFVWPYSLTVLYQMGEYVKNIQTDFSVGISGIFSADYAAPWITSGLSFKFDSDQESGASIDTWMGSNSGFRLGLENRFVLLPPVIGPALLETPTYTLSVGDPARTPPQATLNGATQNQVVVTTKVESSSALDFQPTINQVPGSSVSQRCSPVYIKPHYGDIQHSWAKQDIIAAVSYGLIFSESDKAFYPKAVFTRRDAYYLMASLWAYRLYQKRACLSMLDNASQVVGSVPAANYWRRTLAFEQFPSRNWHVTNWKSDFTPISRIELIAIVSRFLTSFGASTKAKVDFAPYKDEVNLPQLAKKQLNLYVSELGYGGDALQRLRYSERLSRAEAAAIATRLLNWINRRQKITQQ